MPYVDLNTIHNPATGLAAPAAWGDQVRDNLEFLIDPPVCSAFHDTTQIVATSTFTTLNANSEQFDNDGMHSTVSNTSRLTAVTAGRFLIAITIAFQASTTGSRALAWRLNGAGSDFQRAAVPAATAGVETVLSTCFPLVLGVGDFIEARAWQNSGGNLNVTLVDLTAMFLTR